MRYPSPVYRIVEGDWSECYSALDDEDALKQARDMLERSTTEDDPPKVLKADVYGTNPGDEPNEYSRLVGHAIVIIE